MENELWESLQHELVSEAAAALVHGWDLIDQVTEVFNAAGDDNVTIQMEHPGAWAYAQACRVENAWLVETVSNEYLEEGMQLSADDMRSLVEHGWTAPTPDMPNFWRVYDDPVDLAEVARDIVVAFVSAYGATPRSEFTYSPDIALDDEEDDDVLPAPTLQVHEGTGPLERAARTAPLSAYVWLEGDTVVAAASQNPLYVTWAVSADHRSTIGAMIEKATGLATGMMESTFDTWIDTAEFRDALESSDLPPTLRSPSGLLAALPADLQADRLAQLVIMFGPRAAAPIVMTGRTQFSVVDTDDQVDDAAYVAVVEASAEVELDDSWYWFVRQAITRSPAARQAAVSHPSARVRALGAWTRTADSTSAARVAPIAPEQQ